MNADDLLLCGNGDAPRVCGGEERILGEGKDRHRVACPRHHNCRYVHYRNRLIPTVERCGLQTPIATVPRRIGLKSNALMSRVMVKPSSLTSPDSFNVSS